MHALLVSRLSSLRFGENPLRHASLAVGLSDLGGGHLANADELEGRCQNETGAGSWHHAEIRMASGLSRPSDVSD